MFPDISIFKGMTVLDELFEGVSRMLNRKSLKNTNNDDPG